MKTKINDGPRPGRVPNTSVHVVRAYLVPWVPGPIRLIRVCALPALALAFLAALLEPSTRADWKVLGDGNRWPTPNEVGKLLDALAPAALAVAMVLMIAAAAMAAWRTGLRVTAWDRDRLRTAPALREAGSRSYAELVAGDEHADAFPNPAGKARAVGRVVVDSQAVEAAAVAFIAVVYSLPGVVFEDGFSPQLRAVLLAATVPTLLSRAIVAFALRTSKPPRGRAGSPHPEPSGGDRPDADEVLRPRGDGLDPARASYGALRRDDALRTVTPTRPQGEPS